MGTAMQVALTLEANIYNDACLNKGGHVTHRILIKLQLVYKLTSCISRLPIISGKTNEIHTNRNLPKSFLPENVLKTQ